MYPCDSVSCAAQSYVGASSKRPGDQDETFHLDIGHSMFLKARGDKLHNAPLTPGNGPTRILDLGTGTGIWVLDMAEYVSELEWLVSNFANNIWSQEIS